MQTTEYRRPSVSSFDESDTDEEQDKFEEMQIARIKSLAKKNSQRISVSAEAYGEFNKKKDFKPPVHQKSLEE